MFKWIAIGLFLVIAVAVGTWWYTGWRTESSLLSQPVYRVLQKHDRAVYDKVLAEYRLYRRDEVSYQRFVNFANAEIARVATESLARASQEAVLALVRNMVDTAKRLEAAPDDACYRFWFPTVDGPPDVATIGDAQSQAHTLELMAEVIRSAAEQPSPPPDTEAVKDDLARVVNATYEQYGADAQMLANAEDPKADRAKVCAVAISVYERILQLPAPQAGELLRAMAPAS